MAVMVTKGFVGQIRVRKGNNISHPDTTYTQVNKQTNKQAIKKKQIKQPQQEGNDKIKKSGERDRPTAREQ